MGSTAAAVGAHAPAPESGSARSAEARAWVVVRARPRWISCTRANAHVRRVVAPASAYRAHMAVYFIASYDIADIDRYERDYVPGTVRTLEAAGGEVVVASGSAQRLEGGGAGQTVVLRFPSETTFRSWYDGDDYAPLLQLRLATTTNIDSVLATEFLRDAPHSSGRAG